MEENTSKVFVGRASALADSVLAGATSANSSSTLFVINLCASIAPVQTAGKTIPGFETYKLYQVARVEDGRTRHRLRLGFFTNEADAERVLTTVRDNYPTAFVACLSDDDRRFARGYLPDTETTASWKRPVSLVKPAPVPTAPKEEVPAARPVAQVATPAKVAPATAPAVVKAAAPTTVRNSAPAAPTPVAKAPSPVVAKPAAAAPPKAAAPAPEAEIELSWDLPELQTPKQSDSKPAPQTIAPVFKTDTVIKAAPSAKAPMQEAKQPATPAAATPSSHLTLAREPEPAKPAPATPSTQPFHVGKGIEIPAVALSLESTGVRAAVTPAATPAPSPTKPVAKTTSKEVVKPAAQQASPPKAPVAAPALSNKPAASAAAATARAANAGPTDQRAPELDSTQTIRALTSAELNDDAEKWFSIQLVVSERPVNLDAMPHLDIFEAYRVYSIANAGSGKIVYSLRLGFFREEVSAEAVMGYLRTFFPSPTVIRISAAEQTRFKDAPAPKATAAAAKTDGNVIELNHARDRKPAIPTVTVEVPTDRSPTGTFKTNATGSFKVNASGSHKALKPAAKAGVPATKRSAPLGKSSATGRYKTLPAKRSLQEQLLDEAREVQLSESAIRKLPKNDSLLSRLVDKLTK